MNLIPYFKTTITSDYSSLKIKERVDTVITKPDWKIDIHRILNNRIITGKSNDNSFSLAFGRYVFSYGKLSLTPILKCRIKGQGDKSILSIVIRPFSGGLFAFGFFYLLAIFGLYMGIVKGLYQVIFVASLFLFVTYFLLMVRFNYELKNYLGIINSEIA